MCTVGLIDDTNKEFEDYRYSFSKRGIDLLFMEYKENDNEIINWLQDNRVEVLLVDYKLVDLYSYSGSNLIHRINNRFPDLQCFLFTSNPDEDVLVSKSLIIDKGELNTDSGTINVINILKQASEVFRNRQEKSTQEYQELLIKKQKSNIEPKEEERFFELQKTLVSYGVVEDVPKELQKNDFEERIDSLIKKADEIIKKHEQHNKNTYI